MNLTRTYWNQYTSKRRFRVCSDFNFVFVSGWEFARLQIFVAPQCSHSGRIVFIIDLWLPPWRRLTPHPLPGWRIRSSEPVHYTVNYNESNKNKKNITFKIYEASAQVVTNGWKFQIGFINLVQLRYIFFLFLVQRYCSLLRRKREGWKKFLLLYLISELDYRVIPLHYMSSTHT